MLTTEQLPAFFPDLTDERLASAIAAGAQPVLHQHLPVLAAGAPVPLRRAQRRDQHHPRQPQPDAGPGGAAGIGPDPRRPRPAVPDLSTRTAPTPPSFDEVLELLHLGGRSLPHAVLMMIPEAWENHATMDPAAPRVLPVPRQPDGAVGRPGLRHVHRRHAGRRGARPQRPAPGALVAHRRRPRGAGQRGRRAGRRRRSDVVAKGRLQPGRMFLVDTDAGRIVDDDEVKAALAAQLPYEDWLHAGLMQLADLPDRDHVVQSHESVLRRQLTFGYTEEELQDPAHPDGRSTAPSRSARWAPTPRPRCCPSAPRLLYDYFKQNFAQVTNPPLDAIREEIVTSVAADHGPGAEPARPRPGVLPAHRSCRTR